MFLLVIYTKFFDKVSENQNLFIFYSINKQKNDLMTPLQQFIQDLENIVDPETKEWIEKNKGFYIKLEEDEIVKAYNKAELNSGCMLQLGKHYYRNRFT